jgi:uncharacterized coiled-coil protein SlyX
MEKRIIQLETLSALQDETIAQLNKELFRQQQDFNRVLRRLESLEQKLEELQQSDQIAGNEKPPHY